jgi:hypothetical protein
VGNWRDAVGQDFWFVDCGLYGLISVEPGFVIMGPDESNDATGPASAMVGGGRMDILTLEVRRLVGCPTSGPPCKDELIPANRTLMLD